MSAQAERLAVSMPPRPARGPVAYLASLSRGRLVLWCYLLWYLVFAVLYFDPNPRLWLTSLGISAIIGTALVISTTSSTRGTMALDRWQRLRLFVMPLCVSSFSALVKERGFVLIFAPTLRQNLLAAAPCVLLVALVTLLKRRQPG